MSRERVLSDADILPEAILDTLEDEVIVLNREGEIVYANQSVRSYFHASPGELRGTTATSLLETVVPSETDRERFRAAVETALQGEPAGPFELEHELPAGRIYGEYKLTPLTDDDHVLGVVILSRDVTERHEHERNLERAQTYLSQTHQLAATAGFELDRDSGTFTWTSGLADLLGRADPPANLETLRRAVHPADRDRVDRLTAPDVGTIDTELRLTGGDTTTRSGSRIRCLQLVGAAADDGQSLRGAFRDITAQKRRKERLQYRTSVLAGASEAMIGAVLVTDRDGRVVHHNGALETVSPVDLEAFGDGETVLAQIASLVAPDETAAETIAAVRGTDETRSGHWQLTDGRYLRYYFAPVPGDDGDSQYGRLWAFRDVTAQHERTKELRLMRQLLSRALRHNLRNKLTVIEGYASLLAADDDPEVAGRAESILSAAEQLNSLAENAHSVKQLIEHDQDTVEFDLRAALVEATTAVADNYEDVEVDFDLAFESASDSGGSTAVTVTAMPQFRDALYNAVENAAQHNDPPEKIVTVEAEPTPSGIEVRVSDNGPGIPEQELAVVEDGRETPIRHGSGLGLWVMTLVAQNSEIEIDYETGPGGTVVCFRIPDRRTVVS